MIGVGRAAFDEFVLPQVNVRSSGVAAARAATFDARNASRQRY